MAEIASIATMLAQIGSDAGLWMPSAVALGLACAGVALRVGHRPAA